MKHQKNFAVIFIFINAILGCSNPSTPDSISRDSDAQRKKIVISDEEANQSKNEQQNHTQNPQDQSRTEQDPLSLTCNNRVSELPKFELSSLTLQNYIYILEDLIEKTLSNKQLEKLKGIVSKAQTAISSNGFINNSPLLEDPAYMVSRIELGYFYSENIYKDLILSCSDSTCAKEKIVNFLNDKGALVYITPENENEIKGNLSTIFDKSLQEKNNFNEASLDTLAAFFASPHFHFKDYSSNNKYLDDYSIARKIAFFLTGSIPDQLLISDAKAGKLKDNKVRKQHAERLIKNDKFLMRFSYQFISQFYGFYDSYDHSSENYYNNIPAKDIFDSAISTFAFLIKNNKLLQDYINSKKIYANDKIASRYNLNADNGEKLSLIDAGDKLSGLLFHPITFLTTSGGNEKALYVHRGLQLMSRYICQEFPPLEPAAQEELARVNEEAREQNLETVQEVIQFHRSQSNCNSCHQYIDGLGVAFESFDASGNYREQYSDGNKVDASGELFTQKYETHFEMKSILSQSFDFKTCMVRQLNSFASQYSQFSKNGCLLTDVLSENAEDIGFLDAITAIATSEQFILAK